MPNDKGERVTARRQIEGLQHDLKGATERTTQVERFRFQRRKDRPAHHPENCDFPCCWERVPVEPDYRALLDEALEALDNLAERVERDLKEPDKVLCDTLSARSTASRIRSRLEGKA